MSDGPYEARVETAEDRGARRRTYGPKGRSFGAHLVAFQIAHHLWDSSDTEPLRPTFALFACSRESAKAFEMNLRGGRKLRIEGMGWSNKGGHPMEFLKSAGYVYHVSHGVIDGTEPTPITRIEVVMKHLYEVVPGMTHEMIQFVLAVPEERYRAESLTLNRPERMADVDRLIAMYQERGLKRDPRESNGTPFFRRDTLIAESLRFAAAINERSPIPIPSSPLFCVRLLLSALLAKHAVRDERDRPDLSYSPHDRNLRFVEVGMYRAKRAPGLACKIAEEKLEEWIASVITEHENVRSRARAL